MKRAVGLVDTSLIIAWCTIINLWYVHGNSVPSTHLYRNNTRGHFLVSDSTNDGSNNSDRTLLKSQIITALPLVSNLVKPVVNITYIKYRFAGSIENREQQQDNKKLVILPGLALLCFIVMCLMRVFKWYREKGKFDDRGCSYDVASYVILSQGDKDYCDIDTESTDGSFIAGVPMLGAHGSINASKSLQYRIDAQIYDTVSSYKSYLTRVEKEHTEVTVIGDYDEEKINNEKSVAISKKTRPAWGAGQSSNKLSKDSTSSVLPVIDNYVRLKNNTASYLKSSMVKIGLPTKINRFTVQKYGPKTDGDSITVQEIPEKRLKVSYNPVVQKITDFSNLSPSKRIRTVSLNVDQDDDQCERKPRSSSFNQSIKQPSIIKCNSVDMYVQTDQSICKAIFHSSTDDSDKSIKNKPVMLKVDNFEKSSEKKEQTCCSSSSLGALEESWKRRRRKLVNEREIATQTDKFSKQSRRKYAHKSSPTKEKTSFIGASSYVDTGNNDDSNTKQRKTLTPNSICTVAEIHNSYGFQLNHGENNSSSKDRKEPSEYILDIMNQNRIACNGVIQISNTDTRPKHIPDSPSSSTECNITKGNKRLHCHSTSSTIFDSSSNSLSKTKGKLALHRSFPALPDKHYATSGSGAYEFVVQCTCMSETGFNTCSCHDDSGCAMFREESSKLDKNDNLKHSSCASFRSSSISSYLSSLSSNETHKSESPRSDTSFSVTEQNC